MNDSPREPLSLHYLLLSRSKAVDRSGLSGEPAGTAHRGPVGQRRGHAVEVDRQDDDGEAGLETEADVELVASLTAPRARRRRPCRR